MFKIAEGTWQLAGFPQHWINIYLAGDVLIDTGTRWSMGRIRRQVAGRPLRLLALTHCHPDHQGSAKAVCDHYHVRLACHEADVAATEGRELMVPRNNAVRLSTHIWAGPPCPVTQHLRDGDHVGDFRVVHTPGHTPGHVVFFREADRLAIAGDVLANMSYVTGRPGLHVPPSFFSADPEENLRSVHRLAELRPNIVCFGHGPPLRDGAALQDFVRHLSVSPTRQRGNEQSLPGASG
jgi:glyoxylase-like metal-dependent hydrolase (beta-lactamase superfamily II)